MSTIFHWSVTKVQVIPKQDDKNNIVTRVEWLLKAVDEANQVSTSVSGSRSLTMSSNFVPFEQLTENQVLNWCFEPENFVSKDSDGNDVTNVRNLKEEAEAQALHRIKIQLDQKSVEPSLPWKSNNTQGV